MEYYQKINTEEKTEEDKQMAEDMMSENVEKSKENELPSDNVQATLLSVDASKDSVFSSDFDQQKTPENRVEPIVLSDKDSDTEYKDANPSDDNNIPKMRARPEILADIGSSVEMMNISLQEESPKPRVQAEVLTDIGSVVEIVNVEPQEFTEGVIPEAFIFCTNIGTVKVENLLEQGIFASSLLVGLMMKKSTRADCKEWRSIYMMLLPMKQHTKMR